MYLVLAIQLEGCSQIGVFKSLKEAKNSFKEEIEKDDLSYTLGVAIYDLNESKIFGRGDYGFYGDPIEEWENPAY